MTLSATIFSPGIHHRKNLGNALALGALVLLLIIFKKSGFDSNFPTWLTVDMATPINEWAEEFTEKFRFLFRPVSQFIQGSLRGLDKFVVGLPWFGVLLCIVLLTWRIGGIGLAIYALVSFLFMGGIGLWKESLVTVNVMVLPRAWI